ncbi:MAG: class I SAM-dependent methyltransferase [Chloroflexota bacterium]|nr:class I SAM-dependent methyltransferase [Chloroflexota bacterium]
MAERRIREIYDKQARNCGGGTCGALDGFLMGRQRKRALRAARGEVLEIGIGLGASLPHYPPGCRITGVDLSPGSIQRARERAEQLDIEAVMLVGDAQALPFEDARFDTCVSQLCLCTVPDPLAALREVRRVCRPSGSVLLLEHTTSTSVLLSPVCRLCGPLLTATVACHPNRPVERLVAESGLTVQELDRRFAGVFRLIRATP